MLNELLNKSLPLILVYLLAVNIISFAVFAADKRFAVKWRERVPEASLTALAILGGAAGALAAMLLFRHKTKKARFILMVPVLLILQFAALVVLIWQKPG